jgi:hypothetical protein
MHVFLFNDDMTTMTTSKQKNIADNSDDDACEIIRRMMTMTIKNTSFENEIEKFTSIG